MVETAVFSIFHRRPTAPPLHADAEDVVATREEPPNPPGQEGKPPIEDAGALSEPVPLHGVDEGEGLTDSVEVPDIRAQEEPAVVLQDTLAWLAVPVEHDFIGLASPASCTVSASFSPSDPVEITAEATGIYRPVKFRAAPWSGFAYDVAPDTHTGLVAGTQILTARGEVAVENLLPGDTAMALRGPALLPILWIGRCTAAEPPVLIEAGALGGQRPSRSLCVAADHPIFLDPVPVAAKRLVNGTTIHTLAIQDAELFHIDVGRHEVLFAQNVPLASTLRPGGGAIE